MVRRQALVAGSLVLSLLGTSAVAHADTGPSLFVRGAYGHDGSPTGVTEMKATGFNSVTVQPWRDHLDQLSAQGLLGLVWLFGYDNATCSFERDDTWVQEIVGDIAGHPAILAYNVADEPNVFQCPSAPDQIRARAALVKQLDPSKPTYTVVAAWDGREGFPYQHFAGTTDIMGLDVYPCAYSLPTCKFEDIDRAIAEADADGVARYWAILQDFSDNWYRSPSALELQTQFDHWARSRMEGYFVYSWDVGDIGAKPDHLAVLATNNARSFVSDPEATSPEPSVSPSPTTTTEPVLEPKRSGKIRIKEPKTWGLLSWRLRAL